MDERMFALVLVRNGGKPNGIEDYELMEADDRQAVDAFEKFSKTLKFR